MNKRTLALSLAVVALVVLLAGGIGAAAQPLPTQVTPAAPEAPILESAPELTTEPAGAEATLALATTRVSVSSAGVEGNNESQFPALSNDGRYVAFESSASNLVANDNNDSWDMFVHDRQTGQTQRISVSSGGEEGNGDSRSPAISATGRYVAFTSVSDNLVSNDTNDAADVFVMDRDTGIIQLVSVSSSETQGWGGSSDPAISDNGRYIAFYSNSDTLVSGDTNGKFDVFVRDIVAGQTWRVSVSTDGTQGNHDSWGKVSISGDGRRVGFSSWASTLVPNDTNGALDAFVSDWFNGWTHIVSVSSSGAIGNANSSTGMISGNGQYISFGSAATNLVASDTNGSSDAFVHHLDTGVTERVSVSSSGQQANKGGGAVEISYGGRLVVFHSGATNLVSGDNNGYDDVFVHDRITHRTSRVSIATNGTQGNSHAMYLFDISGDSRFVSFSSYASNLVANDGNAVLDVFVREFKSCYALARQKQSGEGATPVATPANSIGCEPGTYQPGEQITITADPADGWHVAGWGGTNDDSSTALTNVVTMPNNDHTVKVTYAAECYTLTRTVQPTGSGTITPNLLKSTSCPSNYQYTAGTSVSLQATANAGYQFGSWSGALSGTPNPQSVTMDGNKSVTANFVVTCYTLTLNRLPSSGGSITASPLKSVGCPANYQYVASTSVSLQAVPNSGYQFSSWSGALSDTVNPTSLFMDGNKDVTANFVVACYTLTLNRLPSSGGSIMATPSKSASCPTIYQYTAGTSVLLTVTPNTGYRFDNWSGALSGSQNSQSVTMDGNKSATAHFSQLTEECYWLNLDHTGNGNDPFAALPQSTGCSTDFYRSGAVIPLTADPANGWHVAGWSGTDNDGSTSTTNTLTMPAGQHTVMVMYEMNSSVRGAAFLPSVIHVPATCWPGPNELEPNNSATQANGPLCSGLGITGLPDRYDVFYIDAAAGPISVTLSNHTGSGVQLQLHCQAITTNPCDIDYNGADGYRVGLSNGVAGRYYVVISTTTPGGGSTQYTLTPTFTMNQ